MTWQDDITDIVSELKAAKEEMKQMAKRADELHKDYAQNGAKVLCERIAWLEFAFNELFETVHKEGNKK